MFRGTLKNSFNYEDEDIEFLLKVFAVLKHPDSGLIEVNRFINALRYFGIFIHHF